MVKNILLFIFSFYLLVLIQTSFLSQFSIKGITPNLLLILIIFINFFEKPQSLMGLFGAFIGGFFLDIFSENFIGFYILISLLISIFIKFVFKRHIQPSFKLNPER